MSNTIRIKRRTSTGGGGSPSSLKNAELAYNEADDILYYGKGSDVNGNATTIPAIGGSGAYVTLSSEQTVSGNKTFSGTVSVAAPSSSAHATTKSYVDTAITTATPDATTSVKGLASFSSGDFTVSSGAVTIKSGRN